MNPKQLVKRKGDRMLTAGAKSYQYDAAGRTTRVTSPAGITNIAYDWESRITTINGPGINASYSYNGLDTRVSKIENSASQTFVRDGAYVTAPVIRDSSASYTPGISERRGSTTTFNHSALKDSTAQTNTSQATTATRQYDAFGMVVNSTGTWNGLFGYAGKFGYQEDASGLKLLGHRYYDPSTGRFLTRDPLKDGKNWYGYCASSPLCNVDPTGLWSLTKWILTDDGNATDEMMDAAGNTFWGEDTTDPNGNPVRIGGFPSGVNPPNNGQTYDGTIHFKDRSSYERYLDDPHWQNHEEGHIQQEFSLLKHGLSYAMCWLIAATDELLGGSPPSTHGPVGHDGNPWEAFAEQYAYQKEGVW